MGFETVAVYVALYTYVALYMGVFRHRSDFYRDGSPAHVPVTFLVIIPLFQVRYRGFLMGN